MLQRSGGYEFHMHDPAQAKEEFCAKDVLQKVGTVKSDTEDLRYLECFWWEKFLDVNGCGVVFVSEHHDSKFVLDAFMYSQPVEVSNVSWDMVVFK